MPGFRIHNIGMGEMPGFTIHNIGMRGNAWVQNT